MRHKYSRPGSTAAHGRAHEPVRLPLSRRTSEAERRLEHSWKQNLRRYAREKNEPSAHATSELSPYLHFGYISSLEVALAVQEHAAGTS